MTEERVIPIGPEFTEMGLGGSRGFTCCNTAYAYASTQERGWGVMRHVADTGPMTLHSLDYWRWTE